MVKKKAKKKIAKKKTAKKTQTKNQTLIKFKQEFHKKLGPNENYSFEPRDEDSDDDYYRNHDRIELSVSLSHHDWGDVEPMVEDLMKGTGLNKYFEISGAGTGFGYRDISLSSL